jgi:hypothetical protein
VKAIVDAPIATRGVATCKPTTIARRGIAINASPNPKADRIKVDRKRIDSTRKIVEESSMSQGKENYLVLISLLILPQVSPPESVILFGKIR